MRALGGLVVMSLVACGGGTPPAQSPGADTSAAALPEPAPAPTVTAPAPSAEVTAGLKAFDAKNYAEARRDFEAAARKSPDDFQALVDLGQTCEKLGDLPCAEASYKGALVLQPALEPAAAELASLYASDGKVDEAMAVARAGLAKHPQSGALHASLAIALATRGEQDPAMQEFEQAIKLTPADPMLHYTFASFLNAWHVRGAAPHLDAALGMVKDDYAMIVSIGHEYRMAGEFASCTRALDRAISTKDGGEPRTERALCKVGLKDDAGALADLQGAVASESSYAPAHYYLGGRLASAKRYKEAAAEYSKYLELAPKGSLAKPAAERLKLAQDAALHDKAAVAPPRKK